MKKLFRNRGLVERGGFSQNGGISKLFHQFPLRKACFHYNWNTFFCLLNIHTCCNEQIFSFMWFTFYQKMIYNGISFLLTLVFKYNFVKVLLLMTFISISISLKLQIFLNRYSSQVFKRSDCTITAHNNLYYNELKI